MSGHAYGVHSEVGVLRKVLVCSPGLAHMRLTPRNKDDLLFDDVMWVDNAKRDHFDFASKMRDRGVDVVEMHQMLAETVAMPEARKWILDYQINANEVGLDVMDDVRAYLDSLPPQELLAALQSIEAAAGRERPYRNAPRTLDLDILLFDALAIDTPTLTVPHPRMHERAFVLLPLAEIAPARVRAEWLQAVRDQRIERLEAV